MSMGGGTKEIPSILWAYSTTHRTTTEETSFSLAFGHGAIILTEIKIGTHQIEYFNEEKSNKHICANLNLLEEKRKVS